MISIRSRGSFARTESFLRKMRNNRMILDILHKYGVEGVSALSLATPENTGRVSESWGYEVKQKGSVYSLIWTNSDLENGFPVAVMIQYGHGTGTGGYVQGIDYINPALRPIFEQIATEVWRVVTTA
jgi:hypothetical protein